MKELSVKALQTLAIGVIIVFFFTSVGFKADVRLLKTGGSKLLITALLIALLVICQNGLAVWLAKIFGLPASLGMCTGSVSMTGGHGTSAAFGSILENMDLGLQRAATVSMAAATFGLIAGSIIGGPVANQIITKKKLL